MAKYSQGPWKHDSAKDGDGSYQIAHGKVPNGINGDFGYPVADTMNRHHCISPEEDEANGKLIAVAWEMAEYLLGLYNAIGPDRQLKELLQKAGVL